MSIWLVIIFVLIVFGANIFYLIKLFVPENRKKLSIVLFKNNILKQLPIITVLMIFHIIEMLSSVFYGLFMLFTKKIAWNTNIDFIFTPYFDVSLNVITYFMLSTLIFMTMIHMLMKRKDSFIIIGIYYFLQIFSFSVGTIGFSINISFIVLILKFISEYNILLQIIFILIFIVLFILFMINKKGYDLYFDDLNKKLKEESKPDKIDSSTSFQDYVQF